VHLKPNQNIFIIVIALIIAGLGTGCGRHETKELPGNSASSTLVRTLDESNFDAEVQSDVVLVDFWATWCGPCKMQAPIVEEVARRVAGKARVAKLDVDTAPKISQRFGVQAIPTLVIFRNGKPEKRFVGLTKAETLVSGFNSVLDAK